jgi:hypothetical protein
MDRIAFGQLTSGALFKLGYLALAVGMLPLFTLFGIIALSGGNTVQLNGVYQHGLSGLVTAWVMGLIFPAVLALFMLLGGWVLRRLGLASMGLKLRGPQVPPAPPAPR